MDKCSVVQQRGKKMVDMDFGADKEVLRIHREVQDEEVETSKVCRRSPGSRRCICNIKRSLNGDEKKGCPCFQERVVAIQCRALQKGAGTRRISVFIFRIESDGRQ
jgi:hypothetical protein